LTCILAALDFANDSTRVLKHAEKMAKALRMDLVLVTVDNEDDSAEHPIHALGREYQSADLSCSSLVLKGEIAQQVTTHAAEIHAEMLVIGSHGNSSIHDILHGHAGPDILQGSTRPVLVIPQLAS